LIFVRSSTNISYTYLVETIRIAYRSEVNDKIDAKQFRAPKGKSTTNEYVDLLYHWYEASDKNASVRALFIDFAKAFDQVDHITVIQKLNDLKMSLVPVR
jgi:hypothetical protein